MDYKELGKRIKAQRMSINLTQEKLAEKVEISESFLGHIERGDRKLSLETLVRIAQELSVSIDFLLLGTVKQEPEVALKEIISVLERTSKKQAKTLVDMVKVLAENIHKWAD